MEAINLKELATVAEAAQEKGCTIKAIRAAIRRRALPSRRLGRLPYIRMPTRNTRALNTIDMYIDPTISAILSTICQAGISDTPNLSIV